MNKRELTPTMKCAVMFMKLRDGKLTRYAGGHWTTYGEETEFSTSTIEGLVALGIATYTKWKEGRNGKFPIECTLLPGLNEKTLFTEGVAMRNDTLQDGDGGRCEMSKSISALKKYVDYMTSSKEYVIQSKQTIEKLQADVSRLTAELAQSRESETAVRLREATNEKVMSVEVERLRKVFIYLKEQSVSPADDWLIQMCDIALKLRGNV